MGFFGGLWEGSGQGFEGGNAPRFTSKYLNIPCRVQLMFVSDSRFFFFLGNLESSEIVCKNIQLDHVLTTFCEVFERYS